MPCVCELLRKKVESYSRIRKPSLLHEFFGRNLLKQRWLKRIYCLGFLKRSPDMNNKSTHNHYLALLLWLFSSLQLKVAKMVI